MAWVFLQDHDTKETVVWRGTIMTTVLRIYKKNSSLPQIDIWISLLMAPPITRWTHSITDWVHHIWWLMWITAQLDARSRWLVWICSVPRTGSHRVVDHLPGVLRKHVLELPCKIPTDHPLEENPKTCTRHWRRVKIDATCWWTGYAMLRKQSKFVGFVD